MSFIILSENANELISILMIIHKYYIFLPNFSHHFAVKIKYLVRNHLLKELNPQY